MTKPETPATGCQCGCFAPTRGGSYLPGHDARHVSVLASYVQAGTHTPEQALSVFRDARPALHNKLVQRLIKMNWVYDADARTWALESTPAPAAPAARPAKEKAPRRAAAKLEIVISEVAAREFGHSGKSIGMVVRLSGHYTIEGREVVRFGQTYREICDTCYGVGYRPEYSHIDDGICYPCRGAGTLQVFGEGTALELARKLRDRAVAAERREAKRTAAWEKAKADHVVWLAERPEVQGWVAQFGSLLNMCEHEATEEARAQYRECYREECIARQEQIRRDHDIQLLEIAAQASIRVISDAQVDFLRKLVAQHAVRVAAREAKAVRVAAQEWVGAVGDKITVTGTLAEPKHFDSEIGYGRTSTSTLYKLTTEEGNVVTWFRTGYHTPATGETITLTATVKKLAESERFGKETQVTRGKIA